MAQSIQQADPFEDTKWTLEQWAAWVRMGGIALGNTSVLAGMIQEVKDSSSVLCSITDDEAIVVDMAIARLGTRDEEMAKVTKGYFLWRCNYSTVSQLLKIDRKKVARLVDAGVAWIDGVLSDENFTLKNIVN
jgi:hypothetical protein